MRSVNEQDSYTMDGWRETLPDPKTTIPSDPPLLHPDTDTTSAVLCGLCYALGVVLIVAALCARALR